MTSLLKQTRMLAIGSCLFSLLIISACTPQEPDTRAADEAAIRDLDAQWSKAASANNLDSTLAFYSDDDATVLPPNGPLANTKQAIRALWTSLLVPGATVSWQATKVELSRSGDLGYLLGTYVVTLKDSKSKPVDTGKLVEVWKRQPDGKWKCVADTYNSDMPLPPPAEKTK